MKQYDKVHKIAKAITCALVIGILLIGAGSRLLDIIAVLVWFWGTNPIAYIIETILKIKHRHTKV